MIRVSRSSRAQLRRAIAWILVACLLRSFVPLTAPAVALADAHGGDFACAGHACGCHTSEQCRRACCCASDALAEPRVERRASPHLDPAEMLAFAPARDTAPDRQTGERASWIASERCRGGSQPTDAPASGVVAVLTGARAAQLVPTPAARALVARASVPAGSRPEPPSPPPRAEPLAL